MESLSRTRIPRQRRTALFAAALGLACVLVTPAQSSPPSAEDPMHGPWPALAAATTSTPADDGFRFPGGVLDLALAAYRRAASPVSSDRCPMTPSCSAYAREAIARYGPVTGAMMTVDRLYREQGMIGETRPVPQPDGTIRWLDRPEGNLLGDGR